MVSSNEEKTNTSAHALHACVIGQNEAIEKIANIIRRARASQKNPKRPIGSFIFMGLTGVGKTELAQALAKVLFGSGEALLQIDMSELERHFVDHLSSTPLGHVEDEEGRQLIDAVHYKPSEVILLSEIEKLHPDAFNILLQILEVGRLTDTKGHMVDFSNTIVIMSSNIGVQLLVNDLPSEQIWPSDVSTCPPM